MDIEKLSLPIQTKYELVEKINEEFTRCKCYIMALGKNRNGSYFSREAVEEAIPTFANIPVVAFLYEDEDGNRHVGGHEMNLVEENGDLKLKSLCVPYGVVPESGEFTFEEVTEANGTKATYLCKDVILWTERYPEIMDAAYNENTYFNQSMEIKVSDSDDLAEDDRYHEIKKFSASALCLLGKSDNKDYNVEPCFPTSSVVPFSMDEQFTAMMDEFKAALSNCFNADVNTEEEVVEVCSDTEAKVENDVIAKTDDSVCDESESVVEQEDPGCALESEPKNNDPFEDAYSHKREAISNEVDMLDLRNEDGSNTFNWLVDFDDTYAYISQHTCSNEIRVVKNFRVAYSYDEESNAVIWNTEPEEMYVKWLTQEELDKLGRTAAEFEAYKQNHSHEDSEVDELLEFKNRRLDEDIAAQLTEVFESFGDLDGNNEFEVIKNNIANSRPVDIDIEALKEKLFAIRGRTISFAKKLGKTNFEKAKEFRAPIVKQLSEKPEPYGGLFSRYGY